MLSSPAESKRRALPRTKPVRQISRTALLRWGPVSSAIVVSMLIFLGTLANASASGVVLPSIFMNASSGGAADLNGTASNFTGSALAAWGDGQASYRTDVPPVGALPHSSDFLNMTASEYTLVSVAAAGNYYFNNTFATNTVWDWAWKCFSPPGVAAQWALNATFVISVHTSSGGLIATTSSTTSNSMTNPSCTTAAWQTGSSTTPFPATVSLTTGSVAISAAGTYNITSTIFVQTEVNTQSAAPNVGDVGAVSCIDWGFDITLPTIPSSPLPWPSPGMPPGPPYVCPVAGVGAGVDSTHYISLLTATVS